MDEISRNCGYSQATRANKMFWICRLCDLIWFDLILFDFLSEQSFFLLSQGGRGRGVICNDRIKYMIMDCKLKYESLSDDLINCLYKMSTT